MRYVSGAEPDLRNGQLIGSDTFEISPHLVQNISLGKSRNPILLYQFPKANSDLVSENPLLGIGEIYREVGCKLLERD